ncbi:MAG: phosphoribosylamine--glycine ligase [Actinobacteria bacterium]|nr:phosphoribosylamine--glycine ligase [Actinomycetota bacterium]
MRVCVVGSGGREHALASVLGRTAEVVVSPGNPGIPGSVGTPAEEVEADLFVVGPEDRLVDGLADRLRAAGRLVLGPGADGARLEGSKAFLKEVLVEAGVPTARYGSFSEVEPALAMLRSLPGPWVVKTDGLAAGKGVLVTTSLIDAEDDVRAKLAGEAFGDAGRTVVVEEFLAGPELSVFALCDGERAEAIGCARDHKRVGDGDTGPNTGGMGAFSPVPGVDDALVERVMDESVRPTLAALGARGIDYRGFLYCGLVLTDGGPKVLEHNVRFGDPEAQVVLPRVEGDLAAMLAEAAVGELASRPVFSPDACVTVVCASEGYPLSPRVGDAIEGLDEARGLPGVDVFCAGVGEGDGGRLVTAGGRVLAVTGRGPTLADARAAAYAAVERVRWPGMHHRTDIAAGML